MSHQITLDLIRKGNLKHQGVNHMAIRTYTNAEYSILYNGYKRERMRMSDISTRCGHHLSKFKNPIEHISFIMDTLNSVIEGCKEEDKSFVMSTTERDQYFHIIDLVANGICKSCAHILSYQLIKFADKFHQYHQFDICANQTLSCLLTTVIQYPSISLYYFKNSDFHKLVLSSYSKLCCVEQQLRGEDTMEADDYLHDIYSGLMLLGNQILRNAYLFNNAQHWNSITIILMHWILKEFQWQLNGTSYRLQSNALWNVSWMLQLSLYHHKKMDDLQGIKGRIDLIKWRNKLFSVQCSLNDKFVKNICMALLRVSNEKSDDGQKLEIKKVIKKVWKIKVKDMECLYFKCRKKAKNMNKCKLYVCRGCFVARYCSKRCQKKDWMLGHHNSLCNKL